jgi:PEGA domain
MLRRLPRFALPLLTALAATTVSLPHPASAEGKTENAARAEALFREASKLYLKKQWVDAEAGFLAAFELNPTYDVAANLGHTQYRLGKFPEAAQHMAAALRGWPLIGDPKPKALAEERMKELRGLVGALSIDVSVPQALVLVDGKQIGKAPLEGEVFVSPGEHQIEARLQGATTVSQSVTIEKGAARAVRLVMLLEDNKGAATGAVGRVGAVGYAPGGAPGAGGVAPPGKEEPRGANKGVIIAGGVTAGVALVVGGVLAGMAAGKDAEATSELSALKKQGLQGSCARTFLECQGIATTLTTRDALANASLVAFIGAGVIGTGVLGYALVAPRATRNARARIVPIISAQYSGLILQGAL